MMMHWPQITMIVLITLGTVKRIVRRTNGGSNAERIAAAIGCLTYPGSMIGILYAGGFFG
jgi:hypothetical protein